MRKIISISAILLVLPLLVFSHGLGGSVEQTVGEHILGIGYNTYVLESHKTISLDFDLFDVNRQQKEFDQVLVEIYKGDDVLLSTFVPKPEFGYPIVDFYFPGGGTYKIDVKFVEKDEDGFNKGIAETTFDFPIAEGRPWYANLLLVGGVIGLAAGVSATLLFLKKRK